MRKDRKPFLKYRIHRKKFFYHLLTAVLLCVILLAGLLVFFSGSWENQYSQAVQKNFLEAEQRLGSIEAWSEAYIEEVYRNRNVMDDTKAMLNAETYDDYMKLRGENSKNYEYQLAYLPGKLKRLFVNPQANIRCITLEGENGVKTIWLDPVSNDMRLKFEQNDGQEAEPCYGDLAILIYTVRDSTAVSNVYGQMRLWVSSEDIFGELQADQMGVWEVLSQGEVLTGGEVTDKEKEWLEGNGGFRLSPVVFWRLESAQADYEYRAAVDYLTLLGRHESTLWVVIVALVLIAAGGVFVDYLGLRQDEKFLNYIMGTLETMEEGDFSRIRQRKFPVQQKENEYSLIASALRDVGLELETYIKTEYILKMKEQETEMRALQHQINPHFLYNTLEMIRSQSLQSGDIRTADAIEMLGALYRARMNKHKSIHLKEEFHYLELYLKIMQLRYGEGFLYQVELEPEVENVETLNFWLQPLAENFFSHGYDRASEFNLLIVTGHKEGDGVRIQVVDNGRGIDPQELETVRRNMYEGNDDPDADIGLRNVYMRLSYFYPEGFSMTIGNNEESGVGVSIFIPGKAVEDVHTFNS